MGRQRDTPFEQLQEAVLVGPSNLPPLIGLQKGYCGFGAMGLGCRVYAKHLAFMYVRTCSLWLVWLTSCRPLQDFLYRTGGHNGM